MKTQSLEENSGAQETRALGPAARRAHEIVASLRAGEPADVFDAFWQLDELPADDVRGALAAWTGPLPDLDRLDAATRLAHGLPMPALRLRTLSSTRDADVLDLGPLAEEQLRLAGMSWDGAPLAAEERLDGELEGSFAGTLERRVLADADAPGEAPLFDVLTFAEDAGVVFAGGTTKIVAFIAYGRVEVRDRRMRNALEEAIANSIAEQPAGAEGDGEPPSPEVAPPATTEARPPTRAEAPAMRAEKKTAEPAAKKVEKKTAKPAAKKAEKKTAKPPAKKAEKKTAKPPAKKAEKKTAKPPAKKVTARSRAASKRGTR